MLNVLLVSLISVSTSLAAETKTEAPQIDAAKNAEAAKLAPTAPAEAPHAEESTSAAAASTPVPKRKRRRAEVADESLVDARAKALNASGKANATNLVLMTPQGCYVVSFGQAPGELISCKDTLGLEYTKRNCDTSVVEESATSEAMVSCDTDSKMNLKFKTTAGVLSTDLRVQRTSEGRSGVVASYIVDRAAFEETSLAKLLSEPVVKKPEEAAGIEEPLRFKASGFVSVEHEMISQYGVATTKWGRDHEL